MDAISNPMHTLLDYFNVSSPRQEASLQAAAVEIGTASAVDARVSETIRNLADDIQLCNFQSKLAQFRQSVSAVTEGDAQISGTVGCAGVSDVSIILKSGESIYFENLLGNVRFSDTEDGGIEVVTDEFIRIYDKHGQLVSENADGSPLDGSDRGDVIFNINGAQVNGNGGNDIIFTVPGNVNIDAGDGDDKVYVIDSMAGEGSISVSLGAGNDVFQFLGNNSLATAYKLYVNGGDGNDRININRSVIGGRIDAGNGNDSITASELLHNLAILGGSGNDRISLKGLANGSVDAGDGSNTVSVEALFSSKVIRNWLSSINIVNEYSGDLHSFTKDSNGQYIPSGGTIDRKPELAIKI